MAYRFRKLKQTLRIIPCTKSIGFSTRANEGDQSKNSPIDGSPVSPSLDRKEGRVPCATNSDQAVFCLGDGFPSVPTTCTVIRSSSESDLQNHLQPFRHCRNVNLPAMCKDNVQVLLPKICDEDPTDDKDLVFTAVKSVGFTSDDILVHPRASFVDSNIIVSTREHIPVDIITHQHFRRLAYEMVLFSHDLPQLDGTVGVDCASGSPMCNGVSQPLSHVYHYSDSGSNSRPKGKNHSKDGPSPEQLLEAREKVEGLVIHLFSGYHNFKVLHKNVVLENNLFGDNKISVGLTAYKLSLLKLRLQIHTQLFSTSMEILSVTTLEQTGVIRIHWRLKGLPQIQNLKFWRLFQSRPAISKEDWEWLEAFSYFHIGKDGLVYKHRIDRMMPDDNQPDLTEKLRGLLNPAKPLVN
ncbi:unnamed protein product [Candidula unifasciata]|uniref:Uncharacterized protein n=1 Tax=Candidula unifasciata TaxID=100452 RepID=A0A8S3YI57_9EUPU|nr:unnamed protein product [Candidula unifasciata]